MYERLVLGQVVGGSKMNLQCVSEFVALGRGEDDAGSQAGAHLGSIEVHPPMSGVGGRRQVLGLGPVDEEVGQCLGIDGGAGLVVDRVRSQCNGPFFHSAGCIPAAYDLGERGSTYDRDGVLLKVGLERLGGEVHTIAHLLVVWVVLLRGG